MGERANNASAAAQAAFGGQEDEDVDEAEQQRLVDLCFPQERQGGGEMA
jgi:hypothetical protein